MNGIDNLSREVVAILGQLIQVSDNHITIGHRNYFFNFTQDNLAWCKDITPSDLNEIFIFIHAIDKDDDNAALENMITYRDDVVKRWRHPISISLYGPHRHTVMRHWIEAFVSNHESSISHANADNSYRQTWQFPNIFPAGWLCIQYVNTTPSDKWLMIVTYESSQLSDPTITIGEFPVTPNADWVSSGKPGYR